jgi:hypothetical protein
MSSGKVKRSRVELLVLELDVKEGNDLFMHKESRHFIRAGLVKVSGLALLAQEPASDANNSEENQK